MRCHKRAGLRRTHSGEVVGESIGGVLLAAALFLTGLCTCLQQDPALYRNSYRPSSFWDPTSSAHLDDQISDTPPPPPGPSWREMASLLTRTVGMEFALRNPALHADICDLASPLPTKMMPIWAHPAYEHVLYTRTAPLRSTLDCCTEK
ncbi:uncharacterized protein TrAFT101_010660 [Trichoderma asperellum]|uniref:uncharacterized protein n=1 Tax=Trichoderma asperellum TaxID=101201 RepID=UPI0033343B7A|nr:hypothetical protein TrAFT101_010660 [Trichoderma asperellum]